MKEYRQVACTFYDELEALATLHKKALIVYESPEGTELKTEDFIADLYSRNREEFMRLESGPEIRLDHILSVDGKYPENFC